MQVKRDFVKPATILFRRLLPSLLLALGLTVFIQSFFLSRTPFAQRSACAPGSAGTLLRDALGLDDGELAYLRKVDSLSDGGDH